MLRAGWWAVGMGVGLLAAAVQAGDAAADGDAAGEAGTVMVSPALREYVALKDDSLKYEAVERRDADLGKMDEYVLTTQTWQGITWRHVFVVYEPKELLHPEHCLLFITGGSRLNRPKDEDRRFMLQLANLCGARVAVIHHVPNQPLFGDHVEDDLITETFLRYLELRKSKPEEAKTWPLLFPMVKSAVRAMDAVEQIAAERWNGTIKGFVVTGASKRGWTTWLTSTVDPRVKGIAPIVIDTLNFQKQMDYQLETWGKFSEQIDDYTRKGLIDVMKNEPDEPLWRWVDPYTYRNQITLPKLMINGTNDRYWTVDALNNYWDDLKGPKYVRYVPNAGHGLDGGREGAIASLAGFFHHVVDEQPLPKLRWEHANGDGEYVLRIEADPPPQGVLLWTSRSDTKDFREVKWESQKLERGSGAYVGKVKKPSSGHVALFGEIQYKVHDVPYSLSTQIRRE